MTAHRFFLTESLSDEPEQRMPLAEGDVRHAAAVLRVSPGEMIDVVDPDGRVWHLAVTRCSMAGVFGKVTGESARAVQPRVALFQGVAKGEKMDEIVRRAVEIGADEIVPVLTNRCVVRLDEHKRASRGERWRRVATSAAKQAKRTAIPLVGDPIKLADALPLFSTYGAAIVLWEEHEGAGLMAALESLGAEATTRVALVVGPEGGFGAEEIELLLEAGVVPASLGANILRTETASLVALTLTVAALGGLGGRGE